MMENMQPKLEASRKELLDLGMRNTLLNYKLPKARGIHIVQERSASIYDILVKASKAMTFLGRPGKEGDEELFELPALSEPEMQDAYNDTRLQTNDTEQLLQKKILNTYYFAKTSLEEQGVNILFLTLGILKWFEKGNSDEARQAPLILIPVILERSSASERFRLRYSGAEIGSNLSLQAKMMTEYNITIPDLPEGEDLDISAYVRDIGSRISHLDNWSVDEDAIELGFFSFGKFLIYQDLDANHWPEAKKPFHHSIVQSLFGNGFQESQPTAGEEHHLDKETVAHELFQVVDADSSQILAMLAVHEGKNMVIQGPPGTGKSQTITNIIANAIGHGKTVLFVAEKMAALEVVKRRLDGIHLGEACLELHSNKANKRALHDELKKVLELGKPSLSHLEDEIRLLKPLVEELNLYCAEINKLIKQSGYSAQEVIGTLLKIAEENKNYDFPRLVIDGIETWDRAFFKEAEQLAEVVEARLTVIGQPEDLLFEGTELKVFLPSDEAVLKELLAIALEDTTSLRLLLNNSTTLLGMPNIVELKDIQNLIALFDLASQSPHLKDIALGDSAWLNNETDIAEMLHTGSQLSELYQKYETLLIPEAWEQQMLSVRQALLVHGNKWYKFLIGEYKQAVRQLAALLAVPMPETLEGKLELVDAIMQAKRLSNSMASFEPLALRIFGTNWNKLKSNWKVLSAIAGYLKEVHFKVQNEDVNGAVISYLENNHDPLNSKQLGNQMKQSFEKQKQSIVALFSKLAFQYDDSTRLPEMETLLVEWLAKVAEIHQAVSWNLLKETVLEKGHGYILPAVSGWADASRYLKIAIQKTWLNYLLEYALNQSAALRRFERSSHEEVLQKFAKLDVLNQHFNRAKVALKHWEGVPKSDGGGQLNVLRSEFNKKSRHMPIRRLMQDAGLAIQAIKPVIMMSPMSIANFVPPNSIDFDLVIFDEASQVRPVDALGAILRGKQLVVVGDTKQMPPTSFFDKLNTETEDEDNVTADMQSILGMCDGQGAPQRMLRWHYRSRHESLISLSNKEFYENKLVIFPSPGSKYRMGLSYHHLPDTFYDKGKTRTNPKEAEKVADAVIEHALQYPKLSLGVVAFSTAQMQAIQNALEIKRRQNPDVESFFRGNVNEPFFVKNLENVQGDERDVIFISIGYGRIENGSIPMSFGPLNNEGGERRLNVLITRAKRRCEVFTNITSSDIVPGPNAKFGIRALKSFLYFAEHGKFDRHHEEVQVEAGGFESVVAEKLRELGYIVREKVGSAGFYVDMAVVDPANPGRYILGISGDGKSYMAAKSARDRDRLRKEVIQAMGWRTYQIWSADWFRNPDRELKLLVGAIERAKTQTELDDIVENELQEESKNMVREQQEEISVLLPVYQMADLPTDLAFMELHLQPFGKLGQWIADVVKVESPVHFEEMARRIADANGVSKIGSRIRYTLNAATEYAVNEGLITKKDEFIWDLSMDVPVVRDRSGLPSNAKKLLLISPEEMGLAVKKIVESAVAIQADHAVTLVAKLFGFARVTEDMKTTLLTNIDQAVKHGFVLKDGDFLKGKS